MPSLLSSQNGSQALGLLSLIPLPELKKTSMETNKITYPYFPEQIMYVC